MDNIEKKKDFKYKVKMMLNAKDCSRGFTRSNCMLKDGLNRKLKDRILNLKKNQAISVVNTQFLRDEDKYSEKEIDFIRSVEKKFTY